jgi:DNA helicase-2/ATP-dependent DNA helicase PcrA
MIRAVADSVYAEILEREYPNWKDRLDDIEQFALFAEGYASIDAFLADVSLYDDVLVKRERAEKADTERIVISTIHQAKGLEWDTVFIIHLADGAFPNQRALSEEGGLEEERRLFYVAVTRAKRRLFLTYPLTMGYEALVLHRPSLFLEELHPGLTERVEIVTRTHAPRPNAGWGWDMPYAEETIEVDRHGERTGTKWKSSSKNRPEPPREYLSPVDDI